MDDREASLAQRDMEVASPPKWRFGPLAPFVVAILLVLGAGALLFFATHAPDDLSVLIVALACYTGLISFGLAISTLWSWRTSQELQLRFPAIGWLGILWLLATASVIAGSAQPVALLFVAALPPLAAVALVFRRLDQLTSLQRALLVLAAGSFIATPLAAAFEVLPFVGIFLVAPSLRDEFSFGGELGRFLFGPLAPLVIVEFVLLAPLIEEALKPLAVYVLQRRLMHIREAFLLGMVAGASFAIMENVAYLGLIVDQREPWTANALLRIVSGPLHPFASGLVAAGYFSWRREKRGDLFLRNAGAAIAMHALWNAVAGALLLLGVRLGGTSNVSPLAGLVLLVLLLGIIAGGLLLWLAMASIAKAITQRTVDVQAEESPFTHSSSVLLGAPEPPVDGG